MRLKRQRERELKKRAKMSKKIDEIIIKPNIRAPEFRRGEQVFDDKRFKVKYVRNSEVELDPVDIEYAELSSQEYTNIHINKN